MNHLLRFMPVIILFFFVAFLSPEVFAQGLYENSYSNPQSFRVDGTNNITANITGGNQNLFSADLRWTLPLLLIAAVILFIRSRERVTRRYYNPSTGYEVAYSQIKRKNRKFKRTLKAA